MPSNISMTNTRSIRKKSNILGNMGRVSKEALVQWEDYIQDMQGANIRMGIITTMGIIRSIGAIREVEVGVFQAQIVTR